MIFELTTPTDALLKSATPRQEHHGEDIVVALTMRLSITGPNTLLDQLSETLRKACYMAVPGQDQLPGVEEATPLLRTKDVTQITLGFAFDGWTLHVDHGVDEDDPISIGNAKVDKFRLETMEGGSVVLSFNVGSNDVSSEEIGLLCGKLGQTISITLIAPITKKEEAIDGSTEAFERDHPGTGGLFDGPDDPDSEGGETDATDTFVAQHGDAPDIDQVAERDWPFPQTEGGGPGARSAPAKKTRRRAGAAA